MWRKFLLKCKCDYFGVCGSKTARLWPDGKQMCEYCHERHKNKSK